MIFEPTPLPGAFVVAPESIDDERGSFARLWCRQEFADCGLEADFVQSSRSTTHRVGTLRGMHYQSAPHEEVKLVRCTRGAVLDVILDLRPDSPTFKRHFPVQLDAERNRALYVPRGFAHGFLTLRDDSEVCYAMSEYYHPESARGVRWNDPAFGIAWPYEPRIVSERDRGYPDFEE